MGRKRTHAGLTAEDVRIISECKDERARLEEEIHDLVKKGRRKHADKIDRLRTQRRELTDMKLAEKFGVTKYAIGSLA